MSTVKAHIMYVTLQVIRKGSDIDETEKSLFAVGKSAAISLDVTVSFLF
jgi:hypothetical protein